MNILKDQPDTGWKSLSLKVILSCIPCNTVYNILFAFIPVYLYTWYLYICISWKTNLTPVESHYHCLLRSWSGQHHGQPDGRKTNQHFMSKNLDRKDPATRWASLILNQWLTKRIADTLDLALISQWKGVSPNLDSRLNLILPNQLVSHGSWKLTGGDGTEQDQVRWEVILTQNTVLALETWIWWRDTRRRRRGQR